MGTDTTRTFIEVRNAKRVLTQRQWCIMLARPDATGTKLRDITDD